MSTSDGKGQQMFWVLLKAFPYYGGNIKQHSPFPSFYSNFDVENGKITILN
jgi:hypothetical protein